MTALTIRPRVPDDDESLVDMFNRVEPDFPPLSVEEWRFWLDNPMPGLLTENWTAECGGRIVGTVFFHEQRSVTEGAYWSELVTDPDLHSQGIGRQLYDHLIERLTALGGTRIYGKVLENRKESLAFAERRGFTRTGNGERLSRLDVRTANLEGFEESEAHLQASGIRIDTLASLGLDDNAFMQRLYEMDRETHADIPSSEAQEFEPFDVWRRLFVLGYGRSADTCWVAMDGDRPVGLARLKRSGDTAAFNAFTGVDREYRGRGIARALKMRTIDWSRQNGIAFLYTGNEAENHRMLSINIRLGYQMLPREVELTKTLQ